MEQEFETGKNHKTTKIYKFVKVLWMRFLES